MTTDAMAQRQVFIEEIKSIRRMLDGLMPELCRLKEEIAALQKERGRKYDPNQPRVPAGNNGAGQWTDDGRTGGTGGGGNILLPRRKPPGLGKPPHPHRDSPYYDPVTGIYDPPIRPTWSPFDFIGAPAKPLAGVVGGGARTAYNAYRLRRYLAEARQITAGRVAEEQAALAEAVLASRNCPETRCFMTP